MVALERHVAEASKAMKCAQQQGARAAREAARVDSAQKEIASLREKLSGKASEIGRLRPNTVPVGASNYQRTALHHTHSQPSACTESAFSL